MKQLAKAELAHRKAIDIDKRFGIMDRWTFLMMQVFEAKSFLDLAENTHMVHPKSTMEELLVQQALFRAFLLSYGKCFASSGKGRSSLDQNKVFAEKEELLPVHGRLMQLRHKFAAHNDVSGLDEALIDVEEHEKEFVFSHRFAIANPLNEYGDYRKAVGALEEYVIDGIKGALNALERQLGKRVVLRND